MNSIVKAPEYEQKPAFASTTNAELAEADCWNDLALHDKTQKTSVDALTGFTGAAWRLERSLAETRAGMAARGAALNLIGHGAVIVGGDGTVMFANDPARRLAAVGGLRLGRDRTGLSADDPAEAARLACLIADAAHSAGGGSVRITRPPPHGMLAATVSPLPVEALGGSAMGLVTLRDLTATADVAPTQLMELFGLTAAETGIVPQLVEGDSAHLIAQSRGVTVQTVRAQAARILSKTGAPNLRALAAMVAALAT